VMVSGAFIVICRGFDVLAAPLQPVKVKGELGVAVRVTGVPTS
jgi:hypothetical protein